ncbi:Fc.00g023240.m01.CDS01 [Cosmosporella sp. VM-42]
MAENSMVVSATKLPSLPNEMIDKIISYLAVATLLDENPDANKHEVVRYGTSILAKVCQISKHFQCFGEAYLYKVIRADGRNIAPLARTLMERPDLAAKVQQLFIDSDVQDQVVRPEHRTMHNIELSRQPRDLDIAGRRTAAFAHSFTLDLTPLLLQAARNLAVFDLRIGRDLSSTMTREPWDLAGTTLDNLRELRLHCNGGTAFLSHMDKLFSKTSVLNSLVISGNIELGLFGESITKNLRAIDHLTIIADRGSTRSGITLACNDLVSFTLVDTRHDGYGVLHARPRTALALLEGHRRTLKTLRLETPNPAPKNYEGGMLIGDLSYLDHLQEIRIPTAAFVRHAKHGDQPTGLLENLPTSICRLDILKETNGINSQLLTLAERHRFGTYPNLTEITLRIPFPVWNREARVPGLGEICQRGGITLTIIVISLTRDRTDAYFESMSDIEDEMRG